MQGPKVYSVTQVNRYLKKLLEKDIILNSLCIKGEISNFKAHSTGHLYFTLKDTGSAIQCVMFKGSAQSLRFQIENGMAVTVLGYLSLYEKTGQYQLYAEFIEPFGVGARHIAFDQLKNKLEKEGLFLAERKKIIPFYPKCICLITSPTGAAVQDMIQIAKRRAPAIALAVLPVLVQGERAADEIVQAIKTANRWGKADLILLGRGGGSMEDLWAFNEEKVARAIAASKIPIISAVGHETDYTIADFVSDLRAPTPSAAAELAAQNSAALLEKATGLSERLNRRMMAILEEKNRRFCQMKNHVVFTRRLQNIYAYQTYQEQLEKRLCTETEKRIAGKKKEFLHLLWQLEALNPLSILRRGYSLTYQMDGTLVRHSAQVTAGERVTIHLMEGSLHAVIERTEVSYGKEKARL